MMENPTFEYDDIEHDIGDPECGGCWKDYPHSCECGSLVHAHFGDYTSYDSFYLEYQCDQCGDDYCEADDI